MKTTIRHSWVILLLILLFSGKTVADQPGKSKLLVQISKETNDTSRINLLIRYVLLYGEIQDMAQRYNEIKELSLKYNYYPGLIYNRFFDGMLLSNSCKFDESILKFKSCIEGLDSLGIIQPVQYPLGLIRIMFDFGGRQVEKFTYYLDKISYYKRHGPIENTANCYYGIGGYYFYLANYDKAIEYYMHAQDVYRSFDSMGFSSVIGEIGNAYLRWGNLEKAEVYLKAGLKEALRLDYGNYSIYCYNNLVDLYLIKHDYKRALQFSIDYRKQHPDFAPEYKAINLVKLAAIHMYCNSLDSADFYLRAAEKMRNEELVIMVAPYGNLEIDYFRYMYYVAAANHKLALKSLEAALHEAQELKYIPLVLKYTSELYTFLLNQGDTIQSFRYLMQYHAIQESLNSENTRARLASYAIERLQLQKENEITQLQTQKTTQRNYYLIGGAFLLLIVMAVISLILYRRKRDKEQLTSDFKNQLARAETKALRAQMNPHFIFNSLNSINNFVTDQKHEIASDYLLKFSKLIRLILDNSRSETIPLDKELETLQLYVTLESIRFENHFTYAVNIAENTSTGSIMIPPMLLQPFIENAIWHGLMQKRAKGTITVEISVNNEQIKVKSDELKVSSDKFLKITITDDGIGRAKAAEMKSKSATHRSHGLKVTSERIEMMNKLNSTGAQVHIIDLKDEQGNALGTRVELIIPF